ncbi:MAG: hypothetical protein Sapg2KO_08140 [Saprospiraceae bacterium]
MKRSILFLLFSISITSLVPAQKSISFRNAEKYNPDLYKEYRGTPYFFSDFTFGWITGADGVEYDKVKMNYNGHTESFEVLEGDRFISLQEAPYKSIVLLEPETQDTITFIRGVHADFAGKFIQLLYQSDQLTMVNQFSINLVENQVNTVGRTDVLKRFKPQNSYYVKLKKEPKLLLLKSNKKSWAQAFGNKKEIDSFIKENKLNLSKQEDMVRLLKHIEKL